MTFGQLQVAVIAIWAATTGGLVAMDAPKSPPDSHPFTLLNANGKRNKFH